MGDRLRECDPRNGLKPLRAAHSTHGADGDRTHDLRLAKPALSQLSYSPSDREWAQVESNYRPHPYQGCALAN